MQPVGNNVPNAPYYVPGKYIPNANNYLHAPPKISGGPDVSGWINNTSAGLTIGGHEAFDHLHYYVGSSGSNPTKEQLAVSPYIRTELSVILALPEGESYVWFLEHNETHHAKGTAGDIGAFGPLVVDLSPPSGDVRIAGGLVRIEDADTFLEISAADNLSGVSGIYIDGDLVDGPNVRQWINFNSAISVTLTPNFDRKNVTVRFVDYAGNQSGIFMDNIFLGQTKYFFYKVQGLENNFQDKQVGFQTQSDNTFRTGGADFAEADEHGEFGDN